MGHILDVHQYGMKDIKPGDTVSIGSMENKHLVKSVDAKNGVIELEPIEHKKRKRHKQSI